MHASRRAVPSRWVGRVDVQGGCAPIVRTSLVEALPPMLRREGYGDGVKCSTQAHGEYWADVWALGRPAASVARGWGHHAEFGRRSPSVQPGMCSVRPLVQACMEVPLPPRLSWIPAFAGDAIARTWHSLVSF